MRARALAAEARREAAAQGRGTPSASSAAHRRNSNDSSEREDEDDVGSVLGSDFTDEDASDTIDESVTLHPNPTLAQAATLPCGRH